MKKLILAAFLAIFALGSMTSCNSDVEPIEYTPQYILAVNISDLMRNGLIEIFSYEEAVSAKIVKGEELPASITVITNALGDTIGWKSDFKDEQNLTYLKDSMTVTFNEDKSTKTIDCSKITMLNQYDGGTIKFFGTIAVTNSLTSETETTREVITNQFGYGKENNDLYLTAFYTFNSKYENAVMNECKISGSASGNHFEYGTFSQEIGTELNAGVYNYFTSGSMTLIVPEFGGFISPVGVSFTASSIIIEYEGNTTVY
ncbi:MAG: hypothetical protein LBE11_01010 [Prevotellaceae bacterium]|nr:hypothetical protein [Prevotellaceae bacterium]